MWSCKQSSLRVKKFVEKNCQYPPIFLKKLHLYEYGQISKEKFLEIDFY
jgi:hypothetical protein